MYKITQDNAYKDKTKEVYNVCFLVSCTIHPVSRTTPVSDMRRVPENGGRVSQLRFLHTQRFELLILRESSRLPHDPCHIDKEAYNVDV